MRLSAFPVFFSRAPDDESEEDRKERYAAAMRMAYYQSKTTHRGDEAAECW